MAGTGVRNLGCSRAKRSKKRPSAAIAWKTRGVTRITRFRKPKVEQAIPAVMTTRPAEPSSTSMVSAAGAVLAASPSTPSAPRYATLASTYTSTTAITPSTSALGRFRSGSTSSSAMKFVCCQPPYAKSTGTSAAATAPTIAPVPDGTASAAQSTHGRRRVAEGAEAGHHDHRDGRQLQHGEDVLGDGAEGDAEAVDQGEQEDGRDRHRADEGGRKSHQRGGVVGKGDGHGGDGAGRHDEEQRPGVEEGGQGPERLAEVGVAAAHLRPALPEFAVDERPDERHHAATHPDAERGGGGAHPLRHDGWVEEDPGADDAADDGHRAGKEAQATRIGDGHSDSGRGPSEGTAGRGRAPAEGEPPCPHRGRFTAHDPTRQEVTEACPRPLVR